MIPRNAKLNEGIDVEWRQCRARNALLRLDRPGVRPGTNLNKYKCIFAIPNLEHTHRAEIVCAVTLEKDHLSPRHGQW